MHFMFIMVVLGYYLSDEDSANTDAQTLTKTLFGAAGTGSSSYR